MIERFGYIRGRSCVNVGKVFEEIWARKEKSTKKRMCTPRVVDISNCYAYVEWLQGTWCAPCIVWRRTCTRRIIVDVKGTVMRVGRLMLVYILSLPMRMVCDLEWGTTVKTKCEFQVHYSILNGAVSFPKSSWSTTTSDENDCKAVKLQAFEGCYGEIGPPCSKRTVPLDLMSVYFKRRKKKNTKRFCHTTLHYCCYYR